MCGRGIRFNLRGFTGPTGKIYRMAEFNRWYGIMVKNKQLWSQTNLVSVPTPSNELGDLKMVA